jgi:hypothetical protein
MQSAVNHFFKAHIEVLIVLAVNAFCLSSIPVVDGIMDMVLWRQRTHDEQLIIYLTCTVTETLYSCRFNQLEVLFAVLESIDLNDVSVAREITAALHGQYASVSICIVLNAPVVDGWREHIGGNNQFLLSLSPSQIG